MRETRINESKIMLDGIRSLTRRTPSLEELLRQEVNDLIVERGGFAKEKAPLVEQRKQAAKDEPSMLTQ